MQTADDKSNNKRFFEGVQKFHDRRTAKINRLTGKRITAEEEARDNALKEKERRKVMQAKQKLRQQEELEAKRKQEKEWAEEEAELVRLKARLAEIQAAKKARKEGKLVKGEAGPGEGGADLSLIHI